MSRASFNFVFNFSPYLDFSIFSNYYARMKSQKKENNSYLKNSFYYLNSDFFGVKMFDFISLKIDFGNHFLNN